MQGGLMRNSITLPVRPCRILPLCAGGCSQQALEHEGIDYCIYDFDEEAKTKVVSERFLNVLEDS